MGSDKHSVQARQGRAVASGGAERAMALPILNEDNHYS